MSTILNKNVEYNSFLCYNLFNNYKKGGINMTAQELIGLRIRRLREENKMSQTTLAEKVGYKDKTAIAKVEAGKVNLPQSKIFAFAEALYTTPAYLLGWEPKADKCNTLFAGLKPTLSDEVKESIDKMIILEETQPIDFLEIENHNRELLLLAHFKTLNLSGKKEAIKRVAELTELKKYTELKQEFTLKAARERTDIEVTDEMRKHDDDIMNDENF